MRIRFVVAAILLSAVAQGQGVPVSGTVRDSIAGGPLGGAIVQIVADSANAMPRMAIADSAGRYRIDGVARGRYIISFLHPLLDSLSLEPILHSLVVAGDQAVTYNLGTPSGTRLRGVFCPASQGGAVVGVVRDAADGQALSGVAVVAEWIDMVISRGAVANRPSSRVATTNASGWFALCGVPGPGNLSVQASRGRDSTDRIDIRISDGLFERRDLFVGSSRTDGALRGRVVNAKGEAIVGSIVSLPSGGRTRTNADGEWALSGLSLGTRILDVRAIGYFPDRRPVTVARSPQFVDVQMATFESVLDTMRVSASILRGADEGGFEQRKRSLGMGKFVSEEDIRRRDPVETSDILKSVTGVSVTADAIKMRGAFGSAFENSAAMCSPAVFLDGHYMPAGQLTPIELDSWVSPNQVAGIEIYHDAPPPQFQVGMSGCGSIVIWTKRRTAIRKPPAW